MNYDTTKRSPGGSLLAIAGLGMLFVVPNLALAQTIQQVNVMLKEFMITPSKIIVLQGQAVQRGASEPPAGITTTPQVTSTPCTGESGWTLVPVPDNGSQFVRLFGAASFSGDDAWAVGEQWNGSSYGPLTEHWNGTQWSVIPISPIVGTLRSIAAISPGDVWAVGRRLGVGAWSRPLTAHWNGTQWTYVTAPRSPDSELFSVAAVASNDVWAVGQDQGELILHWDGTQWGVTPGPDIANAVLNGITAVSPSDIWAVGTSNNSETVTLHWDGMTWNRVASPNAGSYRSVLTSVTAVAPDDIWAVGYWATSDSHADYHGYTLHWDGTNWAIVPNPTSAGVSLYGVSVAQNNDVWAVGFNEQNGGVTSVTMRFDGENWTIVPSPDPGFNTTQLYAVAALDLGSTWAVGTHNVEVYGEAMPLVEQYGLTCPTQTPVPPSASVTRTATRVATSTGTRTSTNTPSTATQTSSPIPTLTATNTYTPSPVTTTTGTRTVVPTYTWTITPRPTGTVTITPCTIAFSDVLPTDYFYEAVRYLYCRGVISGYGTVFLPYNLTTRGQLTKIVTLAEGWAIYTPPSPTFRDVSTTQTFYQYIETAYHQGIISGYACGVGCLEFRPGANVTRAQLSKIIVLAEGWPLYAPPIPTFRDVPTADPFYAYVETAYQHNIISGYSCGLGCLEFRSGNSATRGQICKIVYLAMTTP